MEGYAAFNILSDVDDNTIIYTSGYRDAVRILTRSLSRRGKENFLIYPTLFLWRHYIELLLKHIIVSTCRLLEEIPSEELKKKLGRHRLSTLWEAAIPQLKKAGESLGEKELKTVSTAIQILERIDPTDAGFRYSHDKQSNASLKANGFPFQFIKPLKNAASLLEGIDEEIAVWQQGKAEAQSNR